MFEEMRNLLNLISAEPKILSDSERAKCLVELSRIYAWERLEETWTIWKSVNTSDEKDQQKFLLTRVIGENGLITSFNLKKSPNEVVDALNKNNIGESLKGLFLPDNFGGNFINLPPRLGLELYPPKGTKGNYADTIKIVRKRIEEGFPIVVSDYGCDDKSLVEMEKKCDDMHAFLLTGYKEVWNAKGESRELVKIHNSWGPEWQAREENDGGWMDAKSIFDRTFYREQSIGWITSEDYNNKLITVGSVGRWKLTKVSPYKETPVESYQISPPEGRNAACFIYVYNTKADSTDPQFLKNALRKSSSDVEKSPEKLAKIEYKKLDIEGGVGYFANFIDPDLIGKPVISGNYKAVTPMVVSLDPTHIITILLLTDEIGGPDYQEAMKFVRSVKLNK